MTNFFSLDHLATLLFDDAKLYISEYFIPLRNTNHAIKEGGKWVSISHAEAMVYFDRMNPELNYWYFKEYRRVLIPIYNKNKPEFFDNYINFDFVEIKTPPEFQFLVDEFITKQCGLNHKPSDLYNLYKTYSSSEPISKVLFMKCLDNVGIKTMKSGTNIYKMSFNELFEIAYTNKWVLKSVHELTIEKLEKQILELTAKPVVQTQEIETQTVEEVVVVPEVVVPEVVEMPVVTKKKIKIVKKPVVTEEKDEDYVEIVGINLLDNLKL
jgi:hypothetical protein